MSRFLVKVVLRDLYGMEARVLSDVEVNAIDIDLKLKNISLFPSE
ncbi:hypothetical protein QUB68_24685 [Microcoleus sp. A006_D1]